LAGIKEWFRRSRPGLEAEATEVYSEIKEALRRQQIDGAGADAFDKRARGASALLEALGDTPNAMIRLGDVMVAKATINGTSRVLIENMSPQLARELEQNPVLASDPTAFFAFIEKNKKLLQ
jgi:hypothetical protein